MSTQLTKSFFEHLSWGMKKDLWHCSDRAIKYVFFPIQFRVNFNENIPAMKLWSVTYRVWMMVNILKRPFSFMVLPWIADVFSISSLEVAQTAYDDVEIGRVVALVSSCEGASWAREFCHFLPASDYQLEKYLLATVLCSTWGKPKCQFGNLGSVPSFWYVLPTALWS